MLNKFDNSILLFAFTCVVSLSAAQELVSFSGPTMGTRYTITVAPRDDLAGLQEKVDARLAELNRLMSTYDPESELSQFNRSKGTDWFPVSADTAEVVQFALQVAKESDGAFDPTVGPAVNLWGFGPEGRREQPPSDEEVAAVLPRIGFHNVEARTDPPALRKKIADVYLDLSAVAKGFAVDEISRLLAQAGCADSLVVIGGEIRARGKKPDGSFWRIGIEEPDGKGKPLQRKVQVENTAVGTSGDWQNAFTHQRVRYSHVIDPQTGRPVRHNVASVTVFADKSIQTDAWATALLVMGDERGMAWCEEHGVAAMFFIRRDDGTILARASTHVAKRINP